MALVLLASAGLMVKSFARLQKIDTGFDTQNVLTMVVSLPEAKYKEDHQMVAFFRHATERIRALPGVRSAGMVNFLPLYGGLGSSTALPEGRPARRPGRTAHGTCAGRLGTSVRWHPPGARCSSRNRSREGDRVVLISSQARQPSQAKTPWEAHQLRCSKKTPTEIVGGVGRVSTQPDGRASRQSTSRPTDDPFMTLVVARRRPARWPPRCGRD